LLGMVTERDILRYTTHAGALAFFAGNAQSANAGVLKWMTPSEKMLSVRLDDTLEHAATLMRQSIWRHLPVVDYWGRLHSILDVRDVVMTCFGDDGEAAWRGSLVSDILGKKRRLQIDVGDKSGGDWRGSLEMYLLTRAQRHTASVHTSVESAAKQMQRERLTFLVVVDSDGRRERVVGLVNERSFLPFCAGLGDESDAAKMAAGRAAADTAVSAIMSPLGETLTVSLTAPAVDVVDLFFKHNVRHVPVVDKDHLSGIISVRDLLRPLLPQ